ncbi:MAG TPA: hypothetical protein PLB92_15335, partial [Rhodoglobus sp.]|nr:hypothetical protein [Rhodoglobus sp.]
MVELDESVIEVVFGRLVGESLEQRGVFIGQRSGLRTDRLESEHLLLGDREVEEVIRPVEFETGGGQASGQLLVADGRCRG